MLNNVGQIAFIARLADGSSSQGFIAGDRDSLRAVALVGMAAPAGEKYSNLVDPPMLADSGQVAFLAHMATGPPHSGILAGAPASLQAAALERTAAPTGGNYSVLFSPSLNDSGQVAFFAVLSEGRSTRGIFAGLPGSMQAVVTNNTVAPSGGSYSGFSSTPLINSAGQVAFRADLTGGSSTQGIFVGAPGSVQAVALTGVAASSGGTFSGFGHTPAFNDSGEIAFRANLTGQTATNGIFAGASGSLQTIALQGDAAPRGGMYDNLALPVINGAGQTAFRSTLTGSSSTQGIFIGMPGSIRAIAVTGESAPGGVGVFSSLPSQFILNASGHVAFTAHLEGSGVTDANDFGLYVGRSGSVQQVVRTGDIIDVNRGNGFDSRTVSNILSLFSSGGQDGRAQNFNDAGLLVYQLSFTDGSSGIFTSQVVIPEPGGVVLAVLGAAMVVRRRGQCAKGAS